MFARCNVEIVVQSKLRYGHFYPKESYLHIFSSIYSTYITERKRLLPRFKLCGRMAARGVAAATTERRRRRRALAHSANLFTYSINERSRRLSTRKGKKWVTHIHPLLDNHRNKPNPKFIFAFFLRRINIRYQRMQEKKEILAGLGGGSTLRDKVSATNRISSCSEL